MRLGCLAILLTMGCGSGQEFLYDAGTPDASVCPVPKTCMELVLGEVHAERPGAGVQVLECLLVQRLSGGVTGTCILALEEVDGGGAPGLDVWSKDVSELCGMSHD